MNMKNKTFIFGIICSISHGGTLEKGCLSTLDNSHSYKAVLANLSATLSYQDIIQDRLKPHLTSHGRVTQTHYTHDPDDGAKSTDTFINRDFNIELRQPLINFKSYRTYKWAEIRSSIAKTDLELAKQNLIFNTAVKYLDVLERSAIYNASVSRSRALLAHKEYDLSKFKAGSITQIDLLETSAKYDSGIANEITKQNELLNARDDYQETTKQNNPIFMELSPENDLKKLSKISIDRKIELMQAGNLNLKRSFLNSLSIKKEIDISEAGHLPTLNLSGLYNNNNDTYAETKTSRVGLDIEVPIYEGGTVNDEIERSQSRYKQAAEELDQIRSNLIIEMRKNNHYLTSDTKRIEALKNSVASSKSAVGGQKAGYEAGTRTNLELLNSISELQESESQYAIARYDYLKDQLREKKLVGSLNISDIKNLDALLTNKITISEQAP